jgi:hypothetical protein
MKKHLTFRENFEEYLDEIPLIIDSKELRSDLYCKLLDYEVASHKERQEFQIYIEALADFAAFIDGLGKHDTEKMRKYISDKVIEANNKYGRLS